MITTDRAAAMTRIKSGLIALVKFENSNIKSFDCIMHQESLVAKSSVSPTAKAFADKLMHIVNKIVSAGAQRHRKFKLQLEESGSNLSDLSKM